MLLIEFLNWLIICYCIMGEKIGSFVADKAISIEKQFYGSNNSVREKNDVCQFAFENKNQSHF